MTTTAVTTTAAGPILAIDLGKCKCIACLYRAADRHSFHALDTSRPGAPDPPGRTPRRKGMLSV